MKYRMLKDSTLEPKATKDTIVYRLRKPDYGLARDDSSIMGEECISVTLNENGDYPSFVVPCSHLEICDD